MTTTKGIWTNKRKGEQIRTRKKMNTKTGKRIKKEADTGKNRARRQKKHLGEKQSIK